MNKLILAIVIIAIILVVIGLVVWYYARKEKFMSSADTLIRSVTGLDYVKQFILQCDGALTAGQIVGNKLLGSDYSKFNGAII